MRTILSLLFALFAGHAFAVDDPDKFAAYQQRLRDRRIYALNLRRAMNANKPPAVYYRYYPAPVVPFYGYGYGYQQLRIPIGYSNGRVIYSNGYRRSYGYCNY